MFTSVLCTISFTFGNNYFSIKVGSYYAAIVNIQYEISFLIIRQPFTVMYWYRHY